MTASFRELLPPAFLSNTLALCGERAEPWLDRLPELIRALELRWSITAGNPFPNIGYNYVAAARCVDDTPAVLKIGLPLESTEIYGEAKYLKTLDGHGAVRLLEEARDDQAILLERAVPGEKLTDLFRGRECEAVAPAIELLHLVRRPVPNDLSDAILLDDWFDGLHRFSEKGFPESYAVRALNIYDKLANQPGRTFYLHGDFHPDNIVSATRSGFVVIDPKGIVGHIGYEIAVFLNNFHWWQETKRDIKEVLDRALHQFSAVFELDPTELRQWAFAQMVLSAWWTFDEMPALYDNEVAKADIWDV
jgi:streptomycin 6-kinase